MCCTGWYPRVVTPRPQTLRFCTFALGTSSTKHPARRDGPLRGRNADVDDVSRVKRDELPLASLDTTSIGVLLSMLCHTPGIASGAWAQVPGRSCGRGAPCGCDVDLHQSLLQPCRPPRCWGQADMARGDEGRGRADEGHRVPTSQYLRHRQLLFRSSGPRLRQILLLAVWGSVGASRGELGAHLLGGCDHVS